MEIIGVIIAGIIIGLLGKFVAPRARNNLSLWLTILCGIGGVIIGWYLYTAFGGNGSPGIDWVRWLIAIAVAGVLVVIANAIVARSAAKRNEAIVHTATAISDAEESVGQDEQVKRPESKPDDEMEGGPLRRPETPEPDAGAIYGQQTAEPRHRQVEEPRAKTDSREPAPPGAEEHAQKEAEERGGDMAASRPVAPGRIFISYRRAETAYPTGWLYERLANHFGREDIVRDLDSIAPGDDFVKVIGRAVASCDVMLVVIGTRWISITDDDGRRRLDDLEDFVRREIEAALQRDIRVIPILVDGATMPRSEQLPPSLVNLSRRQAVVLSPERFQDDTDRLVPFLDRTVSQEKKKRHSED